MNLNEMLFETTVMIRLTNSTFVRPVALTRKATRYYAGPFNIHIPLQRANTPAHVALTEGFLGPPMKVPFCLKMSKNHAEIAGS